jgi:uncharacterized protein with von Willebrand factor type A (vWA) domain
MPINDAQLENLLREAGKTAVPPALPADLADRVRHRYFRRRKSIRLGGSLAVVTLLASLGIYYPSFILHPSSFPSHSPTLTLEQRIEQLNRKLDQLAIKIKQQKKELAQMVEYQQALDKGGPLAADMTEYGMALRQRIRAEQAGYMLVGLGEDFLALSQPAEAAKNFKKVLDNFPDTAAAAKAKTHLAKLERN